MSALTRPPRYVPRCSAGDCRFGIHHIGRHAMTGQGAAFYAAEQRLVREMERAMFRTQTIASLVSPNNRLIGLLERTP